MLYSKLGSIPKPETDGTEGWIEVPEPPVAPEGKEVIWWYPPGWVVRDIKPEGDWNWSQSEEKWIASEIITIEPVDGPEISNGSDDHTVHVTGNDSITL
jgi:hypothetical protein